MQGIKDKIRTIPDFPKPGILFRDITTLLLDPQGFRKTVDELVQIHLSSRIDKIAGIEARGFILGGAVAHQIGAGFLPIRKKGKLPHTTIAEDYDLEYGTDTVEIHADAVSPGDQVLLIDDLVATGGTAAASIRLLERAGATVIGCSFVIDLPDLGGRARLEQMGQRVQPLCAFEGE